MARRLNHKIGLPDVPFHNYQYIKYFTTFTSSVLQLILAVSGSRCVGLFETGRLLFAIRNQ